MPALAVGHADMGCRLDQISDREQGNQQNCEYMAKDEHGLSLAECWDSNNCLNHYIGQKRSDLLSSGDWGACSQVRSHLLPKEKG